jgi:hypothetical protein
MEDTVSGASKATALFFIKHHYGDKTKDKIGRTYSTHGDTRNSYKISIRKLERRRPHWRPTNLKG